MNNIANKFPILEQIESPDDLRKLDEDQLPELAAEMRVFLLQS
ncbi:MAG: 1-deoxy-D-xylulose-5-phosphate synthase, partial [Gammaproteobacteria bacterium]